MITINPGNIVQPFLDKHNSIYYLVLRILGIIVTAFFISNPVFCQADYFITDSVKESGVKLVDGGDRKNSRICQIQKHDSIIRYSPKDVIEYGFKDGRVYVSSDIKIADSTHKVFLERLYQGNTSLYYYRSKGIRTFFIEKDSTVFTELAKGDFRKDDRRILHEITEDCPNSRAAAKLVAYNKPSMTRFISIYNHCELRPFPHFRFGTVAGYEFLKLSSSRNAPGDIINNFDFKYDGSLIFGLFLDNPIKTSDFSFHAELLYAKHGFSYSITAVDRDLDFISNFSSLTIPLLVRYIMPYNKYRPFGNIGFTGSFMMKNETLVLEAAKYDNRIEINDVGNSVQLDKFLPGFAFGAGIEYKITYKRSAFFEVRFGFQYGTLSDNSFNTNSISLIAGVNF